MTNQYSCVSIRQSMIPARDKVELPVSRAERYSPAVQNRHWKMKFEKLLTLGRMPNHPERHIKMFTHAMLTASKITLRDVPKVSSTQSAAVGAPNVK